MRAPTPRPRSFSALLWQSFRSTYGPVVSGLGFAVTTIAWLRGPPATVAFPPFLLFAFFAFTALLTLFQAARTVFEDSSHPLPAIRAFTAPPAEYSGIRALCLLEPSALFSQDTRVSFYHRDQSEFERLIGFGHVLIVQQDGLVQVALTKLFSSQEALLTSLLNNNKLEVERASVKPTVPMLPWLAPEDS